jgi:hypothetical protein
MSERADQRGVKFLCLAIVQILLLTIIFSPSLAAADAKSKADPKSVIDAKPVEAPAEAKTATEPSIAKVLTDTVVLNQDLGIVVHNLGELVKKNPKIMLYLGGRVVKGLPTEVVIDNETVYFKLERNDDSKEALNRFLGSPKPPRYRSLEVSVGPDSGPLPSDLKVKFVVITDGELYFWLIFMILVFFIMLIMAPKTEMLRNNDKGSPYSLALTQMAFWFLVVLFSYGFIISTTGEWDTIPESILVLLGIAGGTMLGARVIDVNKLNALKTTKNDQENQIAALKTQDPLPKAQIDALQLQINKTFTDLNRLQKLRSDGFINDILNDVNGISLHRFQIVVWTLVFGGIFLYKVYHGLSMPVFSATQLALIGISSGTYLGFKLPEQH